MGASGTVAAESPRYGVMADLGLPDGLMTSFVYRPHELARTYVGLGHNLNGFGVRAGARFTPIDHTVSPFAALETGHYFRSRTPDWMRETAKDAGLDDKTLTKLGYTFVNGHLGLRFGNDTTGFYLQGGISFVRAGTNIIKPKPKITPPVDLYRETIVHLWIIGGHTGLVYYF